MSQNRSNPSRNDIDTNGPEISFIDIFIFLRGAWRIIVITGGIGLVFAISYLLITPNQYEAVSSISMGRTHPGGANIEEPIALINRVNTPSSFDETVASACGLDASSEFGPKLINNIKLTIPKGLVNIVELKVTGTTPELASSCMNGIYEVIAKSQLQMIDPIVRGLKSDAGVRLHTLEERIAQNKALLAKVGQAKDMVSPTYFAILSEIRKLEDERERLIAIVSQDNIVTTNLYSPIYVSDKAVRPKKALSLVAGLMAGLFLGLLLVLFRRLIAKLKSSGVE